MYCLTNTGIKMGTNFAPLLANLFLDSHELEFMENLLISGEKTVAKIFNSTYRYIDDILSLNSHKWRLHVCQCHLS